MKLKIEWQYKVKSGQLLTLSSDYITVKDVLIFYEDILKTGRVQNIELIDTYDSKWSPKELKKYVKEMESEPQSVVVHFDAGFDGEARVAGLGVVLHFEQNGQLYRIRQNVKVQSLTSNNEAEYAALHWACQLLQELQVRGQEIEVVGDSQVVISQMSGDWPVYEQELAKWAEKVDRDMASMKLKPKYVHVGRKQNGEAHQLAAQALKGIHISSKRKK